MRDIPEPSLAVDQSVRLWTHLNSITPGRVCLITDAAGRDLVCDLLFADYLLAVGLASQIDLHMPPRPWRPRQATATDLLAALRRLPDHPAQGSGLARRMQRALAHGTVNLMTHRFYCSPAPLHIDHLPGELRDSFSSSALTVIKGDYSYRRLLRDRRWPAATPFTTFTRTFPGPLLAIRTIQTPLLAGISEQPDLDAETPTALIQIGL